MAEYYVRVAQQRDFDEVSKHLLVAGELTGDCFSCRQIGIDYSREKYCPQCKTDFKYITYRGSFGLTSSTQVARLCQRRPDLIYIEYHDVKEIADRLKAKNFFK